MVWFVPIGIYEGVKTTAEITDSTVDLSDDAPDAEHVALRIGTGTIPAPIEYDTLLEFLARRAPNDLYLSEWIGQQPNPDDVATQFDELVENGIIMTFGEYPLDHPRMAGRVAVKGDPVVRVGDEREEGRRSIWVDAGRGELLADEPLVELIEQMTDVPVPVDDLYARFTRALVDEEKPRASQRFEASLESMVQTGAVSIMLRE